MSMAKNDLVENELKPCHYRALTALVATGDRAAAAEAGGVSERTLRRWLDKSAFRAQLCEAESEVVRTAARRLGRLADKALGVLEGVMDNSDAPDHPRIRAAATILDTCLRWREHVTFEERIQQLEQRMGVKTHEKQGSN